MQMMLLGILAGLASAILQSCSYVASALFLKRHGNPREMLFYSQGVQALFALPLFFLLVPAGALSDSGIWLANLYWLAIFSVTQLSMFQAQEHVEPSKIATWLGLKIVVLALMTLAWPQGTETVGGWQWFAIALMLTAVTALNFSGGMNPGWKGGAWLATFVVIASLCDRQQVVIINLFRSHGASLFQSALLTLALGYWTFGLVAAGFVGGRLFRGETLALAARKARDSAPFAVFWFTAMMAIYFCYGQLGAVFGNVVQSTRALIAVVIAFLACRILKDGVEQPVSRAMWFRRAGAAFLMTAGIILYSLAGRSA
ncbi:MAG: hypothetical protein PUE68_04135 [Kiritimatiellae bacterium]|nr:hypothetical protein [Kiritimatiellia bacterium]